MRKISAITRTLTRESAMPVPTPFEMAPIKVDEQTARLVNTVFTKLMGIFPAWRVAWPDDLALQAAKREWIAGFIQGGIDSDTQLAFGFRAARKSAKDFIPSVGTFVAWCAPTPADMGLPDEADAWLEALMGSYTHHGVRIAAEATSLFDLKTAHDGDKALRQRFERNYAIVIRRAQNGQPLDGRIAHGIGHDSARPREQIQLEHSHKQAEALVHAQGIPANPTSARAMLLATLNIRRDRGRGVNHG